MAIDFPALGDKVERMRHAFVESEVPIDRLRAEIRLSRQQAGRGAAVPLEVAMRSTCRGCGGRGEVWGECCQPCEGSGHALHLRTLTVEHKQGCDTCFCRWSCAGECSAKLADAGDAWDARDHPRCDINRALTLDQMKAYLEGDTA